MKNETNITILTAQAFLAVPTVDTSLALRITDCDQADMVAVKQKLEKLYGENAPKLVDGARVIDVPALGDYAKTRYNITDAMRIITRLTRPDDGCPWDRVQTHESIRVNLIEEAYEAVDAIDKHDNENMCEEFGDVLLQSLLQSDIARRGCEFDFDDVCDGLCKKLISRHTWLFGGDTAGNAADALVLWDKAKATEKHYESVKDQLNRLPDEFPSLLRCQKAYKKIKKSGAPVHPQADLQSALECKDYAAVIAAACALLAEDGKDAEVELNKLTRDRIEKL